MKLEINKERFLKGISKVDKITSKNSTLPVLSCVLIEADNKKVLLKSTNLDISIVFSTDAKVLEKGSVVVSGSTIVSFLSNLPKNDTKIFIELKKDNLHITSESTDTTIKTQNKEDFPEIKEFVSEKGILIKIKDFIKGLNSVWYSSSTSSIKPELSSIYIFPEEEDLVFVATDSFRLAEKKIKIKNNGDFESVLIPFKNVTEIIRIFEDVDEEVKVFFNEDQIIIKSQETFLSSRIIDGTFPDYKQIIPKEIKTETQVIKEDFAQSLRVSRVFSDKFNQVTFYVFPKDGIFEIESGSQDVGESKNKIKTKNSGEDLKISFNNKYIADCFGSIDSENITLRFNGINKPMIIKGSNDESFMYLVMPMNK